MKLAATTSRAECPPTSRLLDVRKLSVFGRHKERSDAQKLYVSFLLLPFPAQQPVLAGQFVHLVQQVQQDGVHPGLASWMIIEHVKFAYEKCLLVLTTHQPPQLGGLNPQRCRKLAGAPQPTASNCRTGPWVRWPCGTFRYYGWGASIDRSVLCYI